jgi:hypothetical protein
LRDHGLNLRREPTGLSLFAATAATVVSASLEVAGHDAARLGGLQGGAR